MSIAAVVLAAGASSRMGRPKALIEWRGRPFFMHCVDRAHDVGCEPVVVVWGAVPLPAPVGVTLVHNPGWEAGPLSSLQAGLRAVRSTAPTGVLVLTVDRPHVRATTLRRLLEAHASAPDAVIQPSLGSRSGHPVLHPVGVVDALLDLSARDTARTVLRRPSVRRVFVPVDDAAILDNLDTPGDLKRLPRSTDDWPEHAPIDGSTKP